MATGKEFREIHSLYETLLERELKHGFPVPLIVEPLLDPRKPANDSQPVVRAAEDWLELLDLAVTPHMLRSYLQDHPAPEPTLRLLIRFLVGKAAHSRDDRDKVNWLTTQLFKRREAQTQRPTPWPRNDILEILEGFEFPPLSRGAEEVLSEIPALLDEVKYFERFDQITESRMIQRARDLKNRFGDEFFHPEVLAAVVNYNLFFSRKFDALLEETMQKVREFAQQGDRRAPTRAEITESDYRLTTDTLRQLGEIGRVEMIAGASGRRVLGGPASSPEQQMKQLGIDLDQEALYLRNRIEELTMRLRANPTMTSIPNSFAPLLLSDWEASAFRALIPESEQSFRADFARGLCRAIALIYRMYEEIPQFLEKKGSEFLWKRHYDSLVYLLYEGRNHREALTQLAIASDKRGLPEKSRQLTETVQKLSAALAKVSELF
ncbi:MAG TPA: hypothetical protein VNN17_01860 [Terriglobia bacterium]|nr:hypothetical protein [Terriglobia bacterium]